MHEQKLREMVGDIIHEGKQLDEDGGVVIVTASRIGRLTHNGSLDFGGSEYTEAPVEWLPAKKRQEDDEYGWWMLDEGDYIVEYNESVSPKEGTRCYLQIWQQAARNGLEQPFQVIADERSPLVSTLRVGQAGVGIKENARISVVGVL